eukprot:4870947-Heterocapsa_arctica.AAC.1
MDELDAAVCVITCKACLHGSKNYKRGRTYEQDTCRAANQDIVGPGADRALLRWGNQHYERELAQRAKDEAKKAADEAEEQAAAAHEMPLQPGDLAEVPLPAGEELVQEVAEGGPEEAVVPPDGDGVEEEPPPPPADAVGDPPEVSIEPRTKRHIWKLLKDGTLETKNTLIMQMH